MEMETTCLSVYARFTKPEENSFDWANHAEMFNSKKMGLTGNVVLIFLEALQHWANNRCEPTKHLYIFWNVIFVIIIKCFYFYIEILMVVLGMY